MNRREFLRLAGVSALSGASILSGCASSVRPDRHVVRFIWRRGAFFAAHCSGQTRAFTKANNPDDRLQRQRSRTFAAREGRPASHRGRKKRQRRCRARALARPLRAVGSGRRDGRRDADGAVGRLAPIFFHRAAKRNPLVSHPRLRRQRSAP